MSLLTLSFDNGPDPEVTPRVLDTLRERDVRAHFFVLGKHLLERAGRALVERAVDEGHLVGNHSFSHEVPLGEDSRPNSVEAEIGGTEELLSPLIGGAKRFRPFGGGGAIGPHLLSEAAVEFLVARGYTCVLWNSVPRDWEDPDGWPQRALADCGALSHSVLVLHDIAGASAAKLGHFLDRAQGDLGAEIVLELPLSCTPIVTGRIACDIRPFVASRDHAEPRVNAP